MESISCIAAAVIAFAVSAVLGKFLIPFLRKIKFGQTIKENGPVWHKSKQGTPNMGGFMFIIGSVVGIFVGFILLKVLWKEPLGLSAVNSVKLFGGLGMALIFGFIGFLDDYIKDVKKRNLGLNAKQKLIMQFFTAVAYLLSVYLAGDTSTTVIFPFFGQLDLGFFYYVIMILFILFLSNAVNLTDGIDGLAASVTFLVCISVLIMSGVLGLLGIGVYASALAGGLLGFLIYNFHPAKVFMGDTGSLFLGGMVCGLAFALNIPLIIPVIGLIYVAEVLSDIIQVVYFKKTHGKRFFRMAPLHHHLELGGWSETKLFCVFSGITLILCVLAFLGVMNRFPV